MKQARWFRIYTGGKDSKQKCVTVATMQSMSVLNMQMNVIVIKTFAPHAYDMVICWCFRFESNVISNERNRLDRVNCMLSNDIWLMNEI